MLDRAYELRVLCADIDDLGMAAHAQHWFVYSMLLNTQFDGPRRRGRRAPPHLRAVPAAVQPAPQRGAAFDDGVDGGSLRGRRATTPRTRPSSRRASPVSTCRVPTACRCSRCDASRAGSRRSGRSSKRSPASNGSTRRGVPALAAVYAELGMLEEARAELRSLVTPGLGASPARLVVPRRAHVPRRRRHVRR